MLQLKMSKETWQLRYLDKEMIESVSAKTHYLSCSTAFQRSFSVQQYAVDKEKCRMPNDILNLSLIICKCTQVEKQKMSRSQQK